MEIHQIPKKLHYCWFGGADYPQLILKCMESWHKHLPEYEFILWNENNFDVTCNKYVYEAYNAKKWAFVSDYVRLFALYNYGGVYLDADVEILKSIDTFLQHGAFSGFEGEEHIPTGLMGAQKRNEWIKALLDNYDDRLFVQENGELDLTTNTVMITEISKKYGFYSRNSQQILDHDVHIYPKDYFCPFDSEEQTLNITDNTYAIHHFAGSWLPPKPKRLFRIIVGDIIYEKTKSFRLKIKKINRRSKKIFRMIIGDSLYEELDLFRLKIKNKLYPK